MGFFRYRRSVRLFPGVRINLGKRSTSVSIGGRGAHVTLGGPRGTRTTVGLPGTGLSYTEVSKPHQAAQEAQEAAQEPVPQGSAARGWLWVLLAAAIVALIMVDIAGYAATLQPGADQVRVATAAQKTLVRQGETDGWQQ